MELLTFDFEAIKSQVSEVISSSQNIENPKIDDLMANWYEGKKDFIDAFGGKLIIESPEEVTFALDDKTKEKKVNDFIEQIWDKYHNNDLTRFLSENSKTLFHNFVEKDTIYKGQKIPKGMKLVKAMKFFEEDKEILNQMQSAASQLIQEDSVTGKLCFSVHPLDFLSSSENTYNWRSCHALDGEYRAGNLSYMSDSSTIICYLKGEDNVFLNNFGTVKWNSKKWRTLIFFSDDWNMMAPGRQYPFTSDTGIQRVIDELAFLIYQNSKYFPPLKKVITASDVRKANIDAEFEGSYLEFHNHLYPVEEIVVDNSPFGGLHYNDLLYSSVYQMKYTIQYWGIDKPIIHIGKSVKCLRCGKNYITDRGEGTMMCPQCELVYGESENDTYAFCDCCGERFFRDDGEWIGENLVCPDCFKNECSICTHCGEYCFNRDMCWDEVDEQYYCESCLSDIIDYRNNEE